MTTNTAIQLLVGELKVTCDAPPTGGPCLKCGKSSILHAFKHLQAQPRSGEGATPQKINADEAFIVRESIAIIESCFDGEYVVSYNGLVNALNDLRGVAKRLAGEGAEPPKEEQAISLNDYVWVRLTPKGREMLKEQDERWSKLYSGTYGRLSVAEQQESEHDGWSRWQLWALIEAFGPAIHLGCETPFETTIRLQPATKPQTPPAGPPGDGITAQAIEQAIDRLKTMRVSQTVLMRGSNPSFRRQGEQMVEAIDTALRVIAKLQAVIYPVAPQEDSQ